MSEHSGVEVKIEVTLAKVRTAKRLSQRQLAALCGCRPDTISCLERGQSKGITFKLLADICDMLACSTGDILTAVHEWNGITVLGGPDEEEIILERVTQITA